MGGAESRAQADRAEERAEREAGDGVAGAGIGAGKARLYRFSDGVWEVDEATVAPLFEQEGDEFFFAAGRATCKVTDAARLIPDDAKRRVSLIADGGGVWCLRFGDDGGFQAFLSDWYDSLFANKHGMEPTDANKAKVYGKEYTDWADGKDAAGCEWDMEEPAGPEAEQAALTNTPTKKTSSDRTPGAKASSLAMGALANSFLLREGTVDVFRNVENGVKEADVGIDIRTLQGSALTPQKAFLAGKESSMLMLSPASGSRSTVYQFNLEAGKVVSEWQGTRDGADIPMLDIMGEDKAAQLDSRDTFLGLDNNRLCRWDMRMAGGIAQELSSPTLGWAGGKDYSRGTNFQCMATTGEGDVAIGSSDGKVRLYTGTSLTRAKYSFPGLGSPITAIDASYDGKWVIATTDTYILLLSTVFKDKNGNNTTGFKASMGSNIAAPRFLQLKPSDAAKAGPSAVFKKAHFTWITDTGRQERWIAASYGHLSVVYNFRRVKLTCEPGKGQTTCTEYDLIERDEGVADTEFMHDNFLPRNLEDQLVVATTSGTVFSSADCE